MAIEKSVTGLVSELEMLLARDKSILADRVEELRPGHGWKLRDFEFLRRADCCDIELWTKWARAQNRAVMFRPARSRHRFPR